jgi:aspartyl/asparaginyl-tRNA synthetase
MRAIETSMDPLQMIQGIGSSRMRAILRVQTKALSVMTSLLVHKGFDWILPVTLAKSTDPLWPDLGASIEKRIEFDVDR